MPNKCSAVGCTSGYNTNCDSNITLHKFPLANEDLLKRWTLRVSRDNFTPTKFSRLCSLHFVETDFIISSRDSNKWRAENVNNSKLVKRRLKEDAIPSIFMNLPSYFTVAPAPLRTTNATASSRLLNDNKAILNANEIVFKNDEVHNLDDILVKLTECTEKPSDFNTIRCSDHILIFNLQYVNQIPTIKAFIQIFNDLSVQVGLDEVFVKPSFYSNICDKVLHLTDLTNLMALVKSWINPQETSANLFLDLATQCLQNYLSCANEELNIRLIKFICEQLRLCVTSKNNFRYSTDLLVFAYSIYAHGAAAYSTLVNQKLLFMPSIKRLKQLSNPIELSPGNCSSVYLSMRISRLNELQRFVVMIIDEIYIAKRVEYSGGKFFGDASCPSTILAFMIKSCCSNFRDVVTLIPISKLTSSILYDYFLKALSFVTSVGFKVIAISLDNLSTNRKFFIENLCNGNLKTHVPNPADEGKPIFLIFDPTHGIKNIFNNFQTRKTFHLPSFPYTPESSEMHCADFNHIVTLFEQEIHKPVKMAHKLTRATIQPRSIEKVSVRLAASVFHESTLAALEVHSALKDIASGTAFFIRLIMKLWNILNVRTSTAGRRKRNIEKDPVLSANDWKLEFLNEFAQYIDEWQKCAPFCLTKETSLAIRQTCLAMIELSQFLFQEGFNYVLLGSISSDALEERFGWYRGMSGGNYFISLRQVLESERRIKTISLLKFDTFSADDLKHMKSVSTSDINIVDMQFIIDNIGEYTEANIDDCKVIYNVSGYISHSLCKKYNCSECKSLLVSDDDSTQLHFENMPESFLVNHINRGGLSHPTEYVYDTSVRCWSLFQQIKSSQFAFQRFMKSQAHRKLFMEIFNIVYEHDEIFCITHCSHGHSLLQFIIHKFFNCMAKNFAVDNSNVGNNPRKRKIDKLSGSC